MSTVINVAWVAGWISLFVWLLWGSMECRHPGHRHTNMTAWLHHRRARLTTARCPHCGNPTGYDGNGDPLRDNCMGAGAGW